MIRDFDIDSDGNSIVYTNASIYGDLTVRLFYRVGSVDSLILDSKWFPQGPRFFKTASHFCLYGDSKILLHDLETDSTKVIFDEKGFRAGFCEPSNDGESIVFSSVCIYKDGPPSIYIHNLLDRSTRKITDDAGGDRFPHWSTSDRYIAYTRQYLADLQKKRWVGIYCRHSKQHLMVDKSPDTRCILARGCWSDISDTLIYLESGEDRGTVKLFSPAQCLQKSICDVGSAREVLFWDENHFLVVFDTCLELYSLISSDKLLSVPVPKDERIHFRPDGATVKTTKKEAFFLTDAGSIYTVDANGDLECVRRSSKEILPEFEKTKITIRSYDDRELPICRYVPKNANGHKCLFIIGGPGGSAFSDGRIKLKFLQRGYELMVPAYRGCRENPGNKGMMGSGDVKDVIEAGRYFNAETNRRLPIIGFSYGGLLTMLSLASTEEVFACGISLWGVTAIEKLQLHLHKVLDDDMTPEKRRSVLAERSAVHRSKRIRTPLLILHGGNETTSTTDDVKQIYRNVKANGTFCELVVYEDDTHGLPKNTEDYHQRTLNFLDEFT